jgi:hypothetical protein
MATVPTPYDATTGLKISAAAFDAGVRDVGNWVLTDYPRVHAYDGSGNVVADVSVVKLILLDSEVYDTDNMHSTASNTSRIVFTTAGLYSVDVQVQFPSATYTAGNLNIRLNAAGASGGGTSLLNLQFNVAAAAFGSPHAVFSRFFAAADYIEAFVSQTSGASRTTVAGQFSTRVFAQFIATV